jgi:lipopolysaccharide export system permease protein
MRILERYVLREHLFPFVLGFSVVIFLLTLDFMFELVDLAVGKGVSPGIVLELFLLSLGWMCALAFPCAVLIACLAAFGRLSQDNEIAAMRANGVNLLRVIAGPILAALALGAALVAFNNYVLPETNHSLYNLMVDVSRKRPTTQISEGVFIDGFEGYSIFVEKVNDRTNEIRGVKIYQLSSSARPTTILADWGRIHYSPDGRVLTLQLHDGEIHEVPPNDAERTYRRLLFKTHVINIRTPGSDLERMGRSSRTDREMDLAMMRDNIHKLRKDLAGVEGARDAALHAYNFGSYEEFLKAAVPRQAPRGIWAWLRGALGAISPVRPPRPMARGEAPSRYVPPRLMDLVQTHQFEMDSLERRIRSLEVEIQKKFSIPAACLVFVLVGAPLGIRARKSGIGVVFLSILFFVFYWLCLLGGEEMADRGIIPAWLAMWSPNAALGVVGIVLTLRAAEILRRPVPRRRATRPEGAA